MDVEDYREALSKEMVTDLNKILREMERIRAFGTLISVEATVRLIDYLKDVMYEVTLVYMDSLQNIKRKRYEVTKRVFFDLIRFIESESGGSII